MSSRSWRALCNPHRVGVAPETKPFFKPGCPECERKRALGLVDGSEPPPARNQRVLRSRHHHAFQLHQPEYRKAAL